MQAPYDLIPEARRQAVKDVLLEVFQTDTIDDLKIIGGGFSDSPVYKMTISGQPCLLKLNPPDTISPGGADPITCTDIASTGGIAPKLYYCNIRNGIDITAFIGKVPLHDAYPTTYGLMQALGKSLRSIHNLPLFPERGNLLDMADADINELGTAQVLPPGLLSEALGRYGQLREHYPWNDPDKVSSHNDLNPNNILCDGRRLWIIDWSTSYVNDRYYDLAVVANFMVSSEEDEEGLLQAYFGDELNAYVRARFFLMRQICRLIYAGLMLKLACPSEHPDIIEGLDWKGVELEDIGEQVKTGRLPLSTHKGKLLFGIALLNRALHEAQQPKFNEALKTVSSAD